MESSRLRFQEGVRGKNARGIGRQTLRPIFLPSEAQPIKSAPFVQELIRDIQARLQVLDRQKEKAAPTGQHRRERYDVFRWGLQKFGDAFASHKLLIDAIAEEHDSYVHYLEDQAERVVHEREAQVANLDLVRRSLMLERTQWDQERQLLVENLRRERCELEAAKQSHLESATREKAALPDANRKVQDLQARVAFLCKDNEALASEVGRLKRLNASLSVETFSDALLATMEELRETKSTLAEKEEVFADSADAVEDLTRDLKKLCEAFVREARRPPTKTDARLTQRGLNAIKNFIT